MIESVLLHPADESKFTIALGALMPCREMSVYVCPMGTGHGEAFRTRSALNESSMFLLMVCIPFLDVAKGLAAGSNLALKIIPVFPTSYPMSGHMESSSLVAFCVGVFDLFVLLKA